MDYHPLTSGSSGDIAASFPTASISVAADRLALIWVSNSSSSSGQQADPDSITGAGRTWEKVSGIEFSAGYARLSLWRSTGGAGSGALSIDWSTNRAGVCWSVFEVSGTLNLTNNGADTLGTPATNTNTNSTTLGVTLGAFADSNSGAVSGFGHENATDATVRTATADWTEVDDVGQAMSGFSESLETQFIASNDTTAGVTWSAADAATANGGIAVEIFGAAPVVPRIVFPVQSVRF